MFYACVARFNMMGNLKILVNFFSTKQGPSTYFVAIYYWASRPAVSPLPSSDRDFEVVKGYGPVSSSSLRKAQHLCLVDSAPTVRLVCSKAPVEEALPPCSGAAPSARRHSQGSKGVVVVPSHRASKDQLKAGMPAPL